MVTEYCSEHELLEEPVLNVQTDNQVSENWTGSVSAKSEAGQNLIRLYCLLMQRIPKTKVTATYLPGKVNTTANIISRPPDDIELTNIDPHHTQIFQHAKKLKHYSSSRAPTSCPLFPLSCDSAHLSAKTVGTVCNRWYHWFLFCIKMKLTDDDFLLEHVSQECANTQLAVYISYLIAGKTLPHLQNPQVSLYCSIHP